MSRITEASNVLSTDIDIADSEGIFRILRTCDAQIFSGWSTYPTIYHNSVLKTLDKIIDTIKGWLDDGKLNKPKIRVFLSGAGTSGRLAHFCARTMNSILKEHSFLSFDYLMAGGDSALIIGQEGAEDNTKLASEDIQKRIGDVCDYVVYIGITCGFSAPYVASQLNWMMDQIENNPNSHVICALMGFNPVELSRNILIEGWNKSFLDVSNRLKIKSEQNDNKHFIINPVVGPEAITGSTRMKGGTVTIILLWVLFAKILQDCLQFKLIPEINTEGNLKYSVSELFLHYEKIFSYTYNPVSQVASVIQSVGHSLCQEASVYYLSEGSLAILGLIDASECPPTYGAKLSDIRGFVVGGWKTMGNREGDISQLGFYYRISEKDFISDVLPSLKSNDTFIVLHTDTQPTDTLASIIELVKEKNCGIKWIHLHWAIGNRTESKLAKILPKETTIVTIDLPFSQLLDNVTAYLELSLIHI
eukprot:TRINITY_DN3936_c0_g1_i2.p1 TRINITY_DN3936_c0_g1~~TRINITY_DN3936_c0_g1_i2.p1  ORF type:complete len:485 (+),score=68.86 TRINITY_DN3936_c0_g1_i2:33-1457(+)